LLRTTDGGRSWRLLPNPPFPLPQRFDVTPGQSASTIRFATARVGWAFGPALWVTRDGGLTWRRDTTFGSRSDQAVNQIRALETAAGRVWAVVHFGEGNGCTALEQASVASGRWTPVKGVGGCGAGLGEVSLSLAGNRGWLMFETAGWFYYRLTPAGWRSRQMPCQQSSTSPDDPVHAGVAGSSDGLVAIECAGTGAAGQSRKRIYVSQDGGQKFSQTQPPQMSAGDDVLLALAGTRIITATWSAASWIVTRDHNGKTRTALQANDGGAGWRDLGLTTPQQGFVIDGASPPGLAIYMTNDGGNTWSKVRV